MVKSLVILGSTGSIGTQTLDIVARHPDRFQIEALAAGRNLDLLRKQIAQFRPRFVSVQDKEDAVRLQSENQSTKFFWGEEGALDLIQQSEPDLVVSAIVGAAGLRPTLEALKRGVDVALANKESLVIAGELMTGEAKKNGAKLIPVDSEHNAIFQCLSAGRREEVARILLTASGGPFLGKSREALEKVTVEEALKHPNWKMGDKITIDSATLMNKGLEVIEARWLFGFPVERIEVQIHPQSVVHSMVEYCDGSVVAQMGVPDMRCAISYALAYPERIESGVSRLSLSQVKSLTFFDPDFEAFPCLQLAREAAREGESLPAVLNAANEVAVENFLKRKIGFLEISKYVEKTMRRHERRPIRSLQDVLEADRWARDYCRALL